MSRIINSRHTSEKFGSSLLDDFNLNTILKSEENALLTSFEKESKADDAEAEQVEYPYYAGRKDKTKIINVSTEDQMDTFYKDLSYLGRTLIKTIPKIIDAIADIILDINKEN